MKLSGSDGRSLIEVVIEMIVVLAVAPVVVCCLVQGITNVVVIAFPWVAITLIVIGVGACVAAVLASYRGAPRDYGPPPDGGVPLMPPLRRPAEIPRRNGNSHERRPH
jgi:hypothetical protein